MEKDTNMQSTQSMTSWMARGTVYILSLLLLWIVVRFLFTKLSNLIKGNAIKIEKHVLKQLGLTNYYSSSSDWYQYCTLRRIINNSTRNSGIAYESWNDCLQLYSPLIDRRFRSSRWYRKASRPLHQWGALSSVVLDWKRWPTIPRRSASGAEGEGLRGQLTVRRVWR